MAEFTPNEQQAEALVAGTPLSILAGAGTGKTTVITHRIANLVATGQARPEEILALTFADKAAAEMNERLSALLEDRGLGDAGREIHCSTFHSFGAEVIREHAPLLGRESDCRVLSTPESWQLLSRVVDKLDFEALELPMGGLGTLLSGLLGFFSRAKDRLVDPDRLDSYLQAQSGEGLPPVAAAYWEQRLAGLRDVANAYREYEAAKLRRGYLDYGDLLTLPVQLFEAHPEVRDLYRRRYRHLFVDEYQDTNHVQKLLLFELLSPEAGIVVIGDDDQSIYGWRGAEIRNLLDFLKEPAIKGRHPSVVKLIINRRSGPEILSIAHQIVSKLEERFEKQLEPMEGAPLSPVGHYIAASGDSEARWIARTIRQHYLRQDVGDPTGKKQGYGLFAVLCRKRSLFEPIARALEAEGVRYELIGGTGFYGRWEIRDILSYLRVLADPADNVALARILQSPPWRLSDRELFHLSKWAREREREGREAKAGEVGRGRGEAKGDDEIPFRLHDAIARHEEVTGLAPGAGDRLARLRGLLEGLSRAESRLPLAELVEQVLEGAGYPRELAARPDLDSRLALLNLGKLIELARRFEGEEGGLDAFVEYLQYALDSGGDEEEVLPVDEDSDAVKVMTVHQAKGLEFPAVFIPGLAERIFPDPRVDDPDRWDQLPEQFLGEDRRAPLDLGSIATVKALEAALKERKQALKKRELEEERRLFYVALTRAQRRLYLSTAHWYFNNVISRAPSLFWTEVMDTDLSQLLGEEPDPGANPRLQPGTQEVARPAGARSESLARLMLQPDRAAAAVEAAAASWPEAWRQRREAVDHRIASLTAAWSGKAVLPAAGVSCTALIQYDRCPRLYRFLYVDRLPVRPSPWAALGTEVHRRIEEMVGSGEPAAPDEEEPGREYEGAEGPAGEDRALAVADLLAAYRESPYGRRPATKMEESFALPVGGHMLRGRIDRLDQLAGGRWELVDFKSGRFPGEVSRQLQLQLRLYSLAAWRLWGVNPLRLSCHLLFLASRREEVLVFTPEEMESTENWAAQTLEQLRSGEYPRSRDPEACLHCDYPHLCSRE